jgi:hypothetical protein
MLTFLDVGFHVLSDGHGDGLLYISHIDVPLVGHRLEVVLPRLEDVAYSELDKTKSTIVVNDSIASAILPSANLS